MSRRIRIRAESGNLSWSDRVSAPSSACRFDCANRLESQAGRASSAYFAKRSRLDQDRFRWLICASPVIWTPTLLRDGDDVAGFFLGAINRRKREAAHECTAEVAPVADLTTMINSADICSGLLNGVISCAKYP